MTLNDWADLLVFFLELFGVLLYLCLAAVVLGLVAANWPGPHGTDRWQ